MQPWAHRPHTTAWLCTAVSTTRRRIQAVGKACGIGAFLQGEVRSVLGPRGGSMRRWRNPCPSPLLQVRPPRGPTNVHSTTSLCHPPPRAAGDQGPWSSITRGWKRRKGTRNRQQENVGQIKQHTHTHTHTHTVVFPHRRQRCAPSSAAISHDQSARSAMVWTLTRHLPRRKPPPWVINRMAQPQPAPHVGLYVCGTKAKIGHNTLNPKAHEVNTG